jgi:hypothetical protein
MKLTYGLTNEFGRCNVQIKSKATSRISNKVILWEFRNNRLKINSDDFSTGYTPIELSRNNFIIGEFPLLELPELINLHDPSDISKRLYLKFKKSSIQDKENRKNIMEFSIVTSSDPILNKDKVTTSASDEILAEQSSCRIRYERDGDTVYVENIPGVVMSNYSPMKWLNNIVPYTVYTVLAEDRSRTPEELARFIPQKPKGVCFFDMDGTLEQNADGDMNQQVIWACLDRGFLVGIITASKRDLPEARVEGYISKDLGRLITLHNSYMYNSYSMRSGQDASADLVMYKSTKDKNGRKVIYFGYQKAYQVHYWRNKYFPEMPDKCVVLFDDLDSIIKHYIAYGTDIKFRPEDGVIDKKNHEFSYFWTTKDNPLSAKNVAAKVSSLIADGCDKEINSSTAEEIAPKSGGSDDKSDGALETKDSKR